MVGMKLTTAIPGSNNPGAGRETFIYASKNTVKTISHDVMKLFKQSEFVDASVLAAQVCFFRSIFSMTSIYIQFIDIYLHNSLTM